MPSTIDGFLSQESNTFCESINIRISSRYSDNLVIITLVHV